MPVAAAKPAATSPFPAPGHCGAIYAELRQSACSSATTCLAAASWLPVAFLFTFIFPLSPGPTAASKRRAVCARCAKRPWSRARGQGTLAGVLLSGHLPMDFSPLIRRPRIRQVAASL